MQLLDGAFSSNNYSGLLHKNLDLSQIIDVFSNANTTFFENKIALWKLLKKFFNKNQKLYKSINNSVGILVEGNEITSAILGEAVEYLCRSFYNFYASDKLIEHCYQTWSGVTNYYSSFFSLHSLLRLQGRCITLIQRPRGKKFYIFPYDPTKHQYVVCTNGVKKSAHNSVWNIFYNIYDNFDYVNNNYFETIFKSKNVGTVDEEIDFRGQINYEPYQGYEEIRDPTKILSLITYYENKDFSKNEIELLSYLTTDPDYKYYARSVLRIIFSYTLLKEIASQNNSLNTLISGTQTCWSGFLQHANPRKETTAICHRLQNLLGLEAFPNGNC